MFSDYNFFLPPFIYLIVIWGNFFKSNFVQLDLFFQKKDYLSKKYSNKVISPGFYITLNKLVVSLGILNLFFYKGVDTSLWGNHFRLQDLSLNLMLVFFLMNYLYLTISKSTLLQRYSYKSEFFFSLVNLSIFLPFIFFVNTLFTFFFFYRAMFFSSLL